ncbi:alkylation response protein AidB-like acyl-CoA dehydrogenase [Sphingobium sp. OAS761]|nr:alkylation response protein AidB-like acyl-CoA dehydrogenase [Sphingobium sp. OAS761]
MGWLGLALDVDLGGSGQGVLEACIVAEEMGRAGVIAPFATNAVAATYVLERLGDKEQRQILAQVADGGLCIAFAKPHAGSAGEVRAERSAVGSFLLTGDILIPELPEAGFVVVQAATQGSVGVFLVRMDDLQGVLAQYAGIDGSTEGNARLEGVPAELLSVSPDASGVMETAADRFNTVICAELVGLMDDMVDRTRNYLKTRVQFGQPLATRQVLRHRVVDMAVAVEECRALTLRAALALDGLADFDAERAASGAVAKVDAAARWVVEDAIQLHGAMGFTVELGIGDRLKRVIAANSLTGGHHVHLKRHAALAD